jgi:surface polysaccharide O-acyltransferase-like enzyme
METITKPASTIRFAYLDNVRSFVIFLVIAEHSAITYSGYGIWYYREGLPEMLSFLEKGVFGFFLSFVQAWLMGALFFIAAYMATKSLAKRGSKQFLRERLFRLGLPLLIYVLIIEPFIKFILLENGTWNVALNEYIHYLTNFKQIIKGSGPLWFVEALLLFSIAYVIAKKLFPIPQTIHTFNAKNIIVAMIITGIVAFLIRLVFPIGTIFFNLQLCYFSSFIALFVIGILIGENNLFEYITGEQNVKWFKITLITGPIIWIAIMLLGDGAKKIDYFWGGLHWQNFVYASWEAFVAIGFSIGIIAFFKKHLNLSNKYIRFITENAFGIYFFHAPILIMISIFLRQWTINPLLKFIAITLIVFIITLVFTSLARKIKPIRILLK